jgi:arylsulfatase A-like enzyme
LRGRNQLKAKRRSPAKPHRPRRGRTLAALGAFLLALGLGTYYFTRPAEPRDNIILIVIDTCRADSFGCYGSKSGATINLDAVAAEGVRFDQLFGHAPWTLPSVTSLLTSTYPSIHGALGKQWRMDKFTKVREGIAGGAQALHDAGFRTHAIVNAVFLDPALGLARGFDTYDFDPATNVKIRRADKCVDRALELLRAHRGERNFLLLHVFDPHLRYDPPADLRRLFTGDYSGPYGRMDPRELDVLVSRMMDAVLTPPPPEQQYLKNLHLAEVAFVDSQLGRFFDALRADGLYDGSTIVVTSDHGEEFWDHGRFEHGHSLYDELIHLPLIIKPRRSEASAADGPSPAALGRVVAEQIRQIDIMPTLLELGGVAPPATFMGESFAAALAPRPTAIQPREVYSEEPHYQSFDFPDGPRSSPRFYNELISLRADGYKYIVDLATGKRELYHVDTDPGEARNLVDAEPEQAAAMCARLIPFATDLLKRADSLPPARPFDMHRDYFEALKALGYIQEIPALPPNWTDTSKFEKINALAPPCP